KKLSSFDVFCLGVNAIIGSGIFLFPGLLAREAGPASIAVFLSCGILLTFVALCYAELGSIYKRNGGSYVYAREAFGRDVGFAVGWMSWVTAIFSWAAVANAVSSYAGCFDPVFNTLVVGKCIACSLVLVLGILNYRGIKLGAWTVDTFTIAKLAPLILFIAVGIFFVSGEHYHPFWGRGTGTFGHAVFLALWPLQGFEIAPLAAGETDNPQRAVPIATIGSLLGVTALYVLVQAVSVGVFAGLAASTEKPLADAAAVFMKPAGALIMAVGALVSMIGYTAGNALGSPRFHTPAGAIILTTAITFCAALVLNFQQLVILSNLAVICQYLSTCGAVIVLRRTQPRLDRGFKIPFGSAVAVAGCIVSVWLMRQVEA
ncbi:MAG: APC family permease, partial [Proteobacteria bacterium]|nr:APC family permease [Pseudomonadota bacterium]